MLSSKCLATSIFLGLSLSVMGCGGSPAMDCTCTGEDVVTQDESAITQDGCESSPGIAFLGDQTEASAAAVFEEDCCDPEGDDCACTCTEI